MKIFGSIAFTHTFKMNREGKSSSRVSINIMIRYSHNGYRLWNPITRIIINARNVDFVETKTKDNNSENLTVIEIKRSKENLEKLYCLDDNDINCEIDNILQNKSRDEDIFEDSVQNTTHLALNAESSVDNVPTNFEEAKSRSDAKLNDSLWIFRTKVHLKGEIIKYIARLVVKGFMQPKGFDYEKTFRLQLESAP